MAPPPATDLEHPGARHRREQLADPLDLATLPLGERAPVVLEQRRGVVHPLVEPER